MQNDPNWVVFNPAFFIVFNCSSSAERHVSSAVS